MRAMFIRLTIVLSILLSSVFAGSSLAAPAAQDGENADPTQTPSPARVAFVHAAPFSANPVASIFLNTALVAAGVNFGFVSGYNNVPPANNYRIRVFSGTHTSLPGVTPWVDVQNVNFQAGHDYTVVVIGGVSGLSPDPYDPDDPYNSIGSYLPELLILTDRTPGATPPGANQGKLRFLNLTTRPVPSQALSGIDILPDGGGPALVTNLKYKDDQTFADRAAQTYDLKAQRHNTTILVHNLDPFSLAAGEWKTVFIVGGANNQSVKEIVVTHPPRPQEPPTCQVRIRSQALGLIRVTLGQFTFILPFGGFTLFLQMPCGLVQVQILFFGLGGQALPEQGNQVTREVLLEPGDPTTLVVYGNNANNLSLLPLRDPQPPQQGAKVRFVHVATANVNDNLDIVPDAGGTPLVTNLAYGLASNFINQQPGTLDVKAVKTGTTNEVVDIPPIPLSNGDVLTVYIANDANGRPVSSVSRDQQNRLFLYLPFVRKQ